MGYYLNAVLGEHKRLRVVASAKPPAVSVPLTGALGLIPLTEECFDAINKGGSEDYEKGDRCFTYLSTQIAAWLRSLSADTTIAYIEADYFGGTGTQCTVAWHNGVEILPPTRANDAINQVLRLLGVQAASGQDEFDTVALGRHRLTEDWLEEGLAQ